jgi:lipopolysaccharide transport system ATP-binding protein
MTEVVIRAENLGKRYLINQTSERHNTLRDAIVSQAASLKRRLIGASHRSQPNAKREEFWALRDVSFEVKQGEVIGIIGRNGAGKSTLLKLLSRITEPTTGRVSLKGRVASLLEVGTGFHPELTGRENIYLNGAILGMTRVEISKKFDEIVAFAEVEKFLDTPVKHYSSGMYVRLAFAVAAHLEPEILVVDEVLAVGDAAFQKKCLGKMGDVAAREGRTVLFVSHNMAAIQQLTKSSLFLEQGEIIFKGITNKAIEKYLSSATNHAMMVYKVEHIPRKSTDLSRNVEFISLSLNHPTNLIPADSEISFRIKVRANKAINNFRFSMTIFCIDGTPIGSLFSSDKQSLCKEEVATFCLKLRNPNLAPGKYYCGLATGKGNPLEGHIDFDIILDVLHFEVMPPEGVDGTIAYWVPWWGSIRFSEPVVSRVA